MIVPPMTETYDPPRQMRLGDILTCDVFKFADAPWVSWIFVENHTTGGIVCMNEQGEKRRLFIDEDKCVEVVGSVFQGDKPKGTYDHQIPENSRNA